MVKKHNDNWAIYSLADLVIGAATGYSLEKSGIPYGAADFALQIGVPVGGEVLEYYFQKYLDGHRDINTRTILSSSARGFVLFALGDYGGRFLARLI